MKTSRDHWFIKDLDSRYVFMNEPSLKFMRCPKGYDVRGKLESEVKLPSSMEYWPEFVALDRKTIESRKIVTNIDMHYYGENNIDTPVAHLCQRTPLYDGENNCLGIVCHGVPIDSPALLYYMNKLNRTTAQFDVPSEIFTPKEMEIIFWARQKLAAKDIARRLNLSYRTIENRLRIIYQKIGVHSLSELIDYCYAAGLDNYIPSNFIRKGVQLLA